MVRGSSSIYRKMRGIPECGGQTPAVAPRLPIVSSRSGPPQAPGKEGISRKEVADTIIFSG